MKLQLVRPPPVLALTSAPGGGFRLEGEDGSRFEATADGDGWRLEAGGMESSWAIRTEGSGRVRVLLRVEAGQEAEELGRATSWEAAGPAGLPASLLLPDGRLFMIAARGDDGPSFELAGWETPGPYWVARPGAGGWKVERTPAGRDAGLGWEALVLFAAELRALLPRT